MKNTEPLVSIIIITYNSSKYVIETLESAKNQTYKNIELIISDDCSTDNTIKICEDWLKKNKYRFIRTNIITTEKNTGIPANCNRGLKDAKGKWIKYIAGDDFLINNAIELYLNYIKLNDNVKFLHANIKVFGNNLSKDNQLKYSDSVKYLFNQDGISAQKQFQILLRINPVFAPTTFIKRSLFLKYGSFEEKFKLWEDRPMWLKFTKNGVKLHYMDIITVNYRKSEDSIQVKKDITKIYSEFSILIDGYMMDYKNYLGFFERNLKFLEYKRKFYLNKFGLNNKAFFPRVINSVSGYYSTRHIAFINRKYR
ncbi:MAG TPA: glycosyltransferase [Bacteroidia bacterium]|nr:glycosyltransferase [Bacteroidia bacterium]